MGLVSRWRIRPELQQALHVRVLCTHAISFCVHFFQRLLQAALVGLQPRSSSVEIGERCLKISNLAVCFALPHQTALHLPFNPFKLLLSLIQMVLKFVDVAEVFLALINVSDLLLEASKLFFGMVRSCCPIVSIRLRACKLLPRELQLLL